MKGAKFSDPQVKWYIGIRKSPELRDPKNVFWMIDALNRSECRVISERYGLNGKVAKTYSEIAIGMNLCGQRIREIESKALRKLYYHNPHDTQYD